MMRRRQRRDSAQAMVEFVFVGILLLLLVFGLIDFTRALYTKQIITSLSREAGNLSSRAVSLSNTLAAAYASANPLNLQQNGYVILTVVSRPATNNVVVLQQVKGGGVITASRVAPGGVGSVPTLPPTTELLPQVGQLLYVAEVYYRFTPITPIGRLIGAGLPSRMYDVAFF